MLVLLFLVSTEYIRALQKRQTMSMLVRELANSAFRDCVELDTSVECLTQLVSNTLDPEAQQVLPGVEIMVSIYAYVTDPLTGTTSIQRLGMYPNPACPPSGPCCVSPGHCSRYNLDLYTGPQTGFIKDQERIAIAEVYYRFSPIIESAPIGREFYDAAIY